MTGLPQICRQPRPLAVAATAVSGVVASGLLGGTTNAVNGAISSDYFVTVLGWHGVADVWRASIAQGVFEGLMFGIFFSLLFTVATGIITGASCSYGFALKHVIGILGGAYICWAFGGLAAMGLAMLSPEFYRRAFFGVPEEFGAMLRYAWVGGSILGAEFGGFVSVVVGLVVLRANWRGPFAAQTIAEPDAPADGGRNGGSSEFITARRGKFGKRSTPESLHRRQYASRCRVGPGLPQMPESWQ